jgi:hypothetical protein
MKTTFKTDSLSVSILGTKSVNTEITAPWNCKETMSIINKYIVNGNLLPEALQLFDLFNKNRQMQLRKISEREFKL